MVIVSLKFVIGFNKITNISYNNTTLIYFWLTEDRAREQRPFWNINEIREKGFLGNREEIGKVKQPASI